MAYLLLLQAPIVGLNAGLALERPLGDFQRLSFAHSFVSRGGYLPGLAAAVALAIPVVFTARAPEPLITRFGAIARPAAAMAGLASAVLVVLGAMRFSQYPPIEDYVSNLAVHAFLPDPAELACAASPPGRELFGGLSCATPEREAAPLTLQFLCSERRAPGQKCALMARPEGGVWTSPIMARVGGGPVVIRRDDMSRRFFAQQEQIDEVPIPFHRVRARDVSAAAAAPLPWLVLATAGLSVALLAAVASLFTRLRARRIREGREATLQDDGSLSSDLHGEFSADDCLRSDHGGRPGPVVVLAHRSGSPPDYRHMPTTGTARLLTGTKVVLLASLESLRSDLACLALAILIASSAPLVVALMFGFVV